MKAILTICIAAIISFSPTLFAQAGAGNRGGEFRKLVGSTLTQDEREQLREAMAAIKDDPEVQAAREAAQEARDNAREVTREALLAEDPSLEPVLDRIRDTVEDRRAAKQEKRGKRQQQ